MSPFENKITDLSKIYKIAKDLVSEHLIYL